MAGILTVPSALARGSCHHPGFDKEGEVPPSINTEEVLNSLFSGVLAPTHYNIYGTQAVKPGLARTC